MRDAFKELEKIHATYVAVLTDEEQTGRQNSVFLV